MTKLLNPRFDDDPQSKIEFEKGIKTVVSECARISAAHGAKYLLEYFVRERKVCVNERDSKGFNLLDYAAKGLFN